MEFLQKSNRLSLILYNKINATVEKINQLFRQIICSTQNHMNRNQQERNNQTETFLGLVRDLWCHKRAQIICETLSI